MTAHRNSETPASAGVSSYSGGVYERRRVCPGCGGCARAAAGVYVLREIGRISTTDAPSTQLRHRQLSRRTLKSAHARSCRPTHDQWEPTGDVLPGEGSRPAVLGSDPACAFKSATTATAVHQLSQLCGHRGGCALAAPNVSALREIGRISTVDARSTRLTHAQLGPRTLRSAHSPSTQPTHAQVGRRTLNSANARRPVHPRERGDGRHTMASVTPVGNSVRSS